ncbi:YbbR-like domain-containing protein [Bacillus sp. ISL-40]|uniref:CdaR family protein n=1 Tax=unclassified Bacillus (in: firmicutes) TaxID=185979 RepID=UPI001BE4F01C|nr:MULTISPECIES: CdaR family protein [unclassified Bacillus (in: firmicutes)]MBT2699745.1 YbbR-like domain-containing protein [Bacillus sp. ISL-40]MBT2722242.1 YbbR-like domain-containing protein [Bacillus sp. ISL-46]MBT2740661.1 YbbR-like domain-containing protein [Bacillus sp. ISL-77]
MDKLMDNPWFIKILALLLAVLLYSSVPHTGKKITDVNVPGEQSTETITNIPVKVYYDTENLVVSGIPATVDITLKGPITHIQSAKALKNFEVYVDLSKAKIGKQKVKLKVRDLSDKLSATVKPASVNVSVQEKITKEFKVEAEFNASQIEAGYSAGQPVVEPNKVKITGAKSVIDRITYVKAALEEKDQLKETISEEAHVQVLDKDLNKLNVVVDPETVEITIPIKSNSKTVPIKIVRNGTAPEGVTIESIDIDEKEATITGDEDVLKNTDNVRVEVDLSKITDNTTLTLPVIISNGITKVTPQIVKATVVVKKQEEKTVSDVPLNIQGLSEEYKATINDPGNQMINILINGPSSAVSSIRPEDFKVFIDLSGLVEGDHIVDIHVEGPSAVKWKPIKSSAKITIEKNNA